MAKYEIWKAVDEYGNEEYVGTVRAESADEAENRYIQWLFDLLGLYGTTEERLEEIAKEKQAIYAKTAEQI